MVTHEDDIAEHAKRIIRMRDGLIIDDGPSPRMRAVAAANGAAHTA
jgi:putative ABC transport system ATP-binding protein